MSACTPAPAVRALLAQVDAAFPRRSRASDGICGDARHQATVSDHNQGNAVDITRDEALGPDLEALARALLADPRCAYVIYKRRIANPARQDGAWRPYTGANAHDHHLHVSVRAELREDAGPWPVPSAGSPGGAAAAAVPWNPIRAGLVAPSGEVTSKGFRVAGGLALAVAGAYGVVRALRHRAPQLPRRRR